jgi:hypothetical protein
MPSGLPTQSKVPNIVLWVNTTLNRLMSSFNAVSSTASFTLKQGDIVGVEVHVLRSDSDDQIAEYQMPAAGGMTLAIGKIDTAPTSGDFELSYNTETTSTLPHNATASQLQIALNALPSIAALGGVVVIKNSTIYRITWNVKCVVPFPITVSRNTLYPTSSVAISIITAGSITANQTIQIHAKQAPVAHILSFESQDPCEAFYSQIRDAAFDGDTKIWRIELNTKPKGGAFVASFNVGSTPYTTSPISVEASSIELQNALNAQFATSWTVSKNSDYSWDISTYNYAVNNLAASSNAIISYNSKYGILNMNTIQVEELLSGQPSATATVEIELESNGTHKTLYQGDCTILNDLIDTDSYSLNQYGNFIPADSVVRYDTSQSLSSVEKLQARTNIGAVDDSSISALQAKDLQIEGRISNIEVQSLSLSQLEAINANGTLSGTNPVVSISQLASNLSNYAGILHSHEISDIASLQNSLDNKSSISHGHDIQSIVGLNQALSLKLNTADAVNVYAPISHTHNAFTNIAVDSLVSFGSITTTTLDASSSVGAGDIVAKTLIQVGGQIGATNYPDSMLNVTGTLQVISAQDSFGQGLINCRDIVATKKISADEISTNKFTNPATGSEFFLQDAVILEDYGPQPNPNYVFTQWILIQFGEGGPKFRIPAQEVV